MDHHRFAHLAQVLGRRVEKREPNSCWPWTGATNNMGYGVINLHSFGRKNVLAHRAAVEVSLGKQISNEIVRHDCDNPLCCNPTHLRLGSQADNLGDMVARNRSCKGVKNAHAKLDDQMVRAIRLDPRSSRELAKVYPASRQTIDKARARKTWRHV